MTVLGGLSLIGASGGWSCAVRGLPTPPGPTPPASVRAVTAVSTSIGVEVRVETPTLDLNGEPIEEPIRAVVQVGRPECSSTRLLYGDSESPIVVPKPRGPITVRAAGIRQGRLGPLSPARTIRWSAPPPPPAQPRVVLGDGRRATVYLPSPHSPVTTIQLRLDGETHGPAAKKAGPVEITMGLGKHAISLVGHGPGFRTDPSPATVVTISPEPGGKR